MPFISLSFFIVSYHVFWDIAFLYLYFSSSVDSITCIILLLNECSMLEISIQLYVVNQLLKINPLHSFVRNRVEAVILFQHSERLLSYDGRDNISFLSQQNSNVIYLSLAASSLHRFQLKHKTFLCLSWIRLNRALGQLCSVEWNRSCKEVLNVSENPRGFDLLWVF